MASAKGHKRGHEPHVHGHFGGEAHLSLPGSQLGGNQSRTHTGELHNRKGHHLPSLKGDGMAHPSHHAHNKAHGTHRGFAPGMEYEDGGCDHHLGDNVAEED